MKYLVWTMVLAINLFFSGCSSKKDINVPSDIHGSFEWNGHVHSLKNFFWQDQEVNINKKMNWDEAQKYCSSLTINQISNFRLPTIEELHVLRRALNKSENILNFMHGKVGKSRNLMSRGKSYFHWDDTYWAKDISKKNPNKAMSLRSKDYGWQYGSLKNKTDLANVRCVSKRYKSDVYGMPKLELYTKKFIIKHGRPLIKSAFYDKNKQEFTILVSSLKTNYSQKIVVPVKLQDASKVNMVLNDPKFIPTIQFQVSNGKLTPNGIKELKNYSNYLNNEYKESSDSIEIKRKTVMSKKIEETRKEWFNINYKDFYRLISGNTLISKNQRFCSKNSSKSSCLKIAILEPSEDFSFGSLQATVIYPDKRKIQKDKWGYYAMTLMEYGINTGIVKIPTESSQYPFNKLVYMNKNKSRFRIIYEESKEIIEVTIQKGQNNKFIANAKNGNYKKVDNTGSMTIGQALLGKAVEKIGKSLAEAAKSGSTSSNESFCYSSDIKSNRDRQMCLATVKSDKSYCFSSDIRDDGDRQMCIASATRDKNYCYSSDIKSDRDRQMCLATTSRDKNYCYSSDIKSDRDKQMCLALSTGKRSYCYSSEITSDRDRQMCIAQTQ